MRLGAVLVTATVAVLVLPAEAQTGAPRAPIARIGEQAIYEDELFPLIGGSLWQLRLQEYETKRQGLEALIDQRVLAAEAKARGLSVEQLVAEATRGAGEPKESEAQAVYEAQKQRVKKTIEEIRAQMAQARRQRARESYVAELRKKAGVAVLLTRPRVQVEADPARVRGRLDAPVTIIEFSDFECPHCQVAQAPLRAVLAKYEGRVRLGFRDYPIRQIHSRAQAAAEAARCAGAQGRFWEYHDALFTTGAKLDNEGLLEQAKKAGLAIEPFTKCLAGGGFRESIEHDIQLGNISGVSATPSFYINGQLVTGFIDVTALSNLIEAELARVAR